MIEKTVTSVSIIVIGMLGGYPDYVNDQYQYTVSSMYQNPLYKQTATSLKSAVSNVLQNDLQVEILNSFDILAEQSSSFDNETAQYLSDNWFELLF